MPSIAAMPDEPKRPGLVVQHPSAKVTFTGPTAFDIQQAKIAQFADGLYCVAVQYAHLAGATYRELNPRQQAHYLNAARIGWEAAQKVRGL